jgi:hypothetical protein
LADFFGDCASLMTLDDDFMALESLGAIADKSSLLTVKLEISMNQSQSLSPTCISAKN